tara:strand:+ start:540 stop:800 length:261 start_codon:yes stop_codon:yes gene_type:complete
MFNQDNNGEDMIDLSDFFETVQRDAMESGYELFKLYGITGMKEELGSKNPVKMANKLIKYFIKYEEYEKCAVLVKLIEEFKTCQIK